MGTENIVCGLKVANEAVGKELDGFISSLPGFTVEKDIASGQWDLLVIEVNGNADGEISFARDALASNMTKNIFFTSPQMDPESAHRSPQDRRKGLLPPAHRLQ